MKYYRFYVDEEIDGMFGEKYMSNKFLVVIWFKVVFVLVIVLGVSLLFLDIFLIISKFYDREGEYI